MRSEWLTLSFYKYAVFTIQTRAHIGPKPRVSIKQYNVC